MRSHLIQNFLDIKVYSVFKNVYKMYYCIKVIALLLKLEFAQPMIQRVLTFYEIILTSLPNVKPVRFDRISWKENCWYNVNVNNDYKLRTWFGSVISTQVCSCGANGCFFEISWCYLWLEINYSKFEVNLCTICNLPLNEFIFHTMIQQTRMSRYDMLHTHL